MTPVSIARDEIKIVIYAAVSLLIGLSIMLWPVSHMFEVGPLAGLSLGEYWLPYIAVMLITVSVIDSVVSGVPSVSQAISHIAWVSMMALISFRAMEHLNGIYLLAMLWAVHSLRSLPSLWLGEHRWWLWPSWMRDTGIALMLFVWSSRILTV